MKVRVTFKSPDSAHMGIKAAVNDMDFDLRCTIDGEVPEDNVERADQETRLHRAISEKISKFIEYGEYLTVDFSISTEGNKLGEVTAVVIPTSQT